MVTINEQHRTNKLLVISNISGSLVSMSLTTCKNSPFVDFDEIEMREPVRITSVTICPMGYR